MKIDVEDSNGESHLRYLAICFDPRNTDHGSLNARLYHLDRLGDHPTSNRRESVHPVFTHYRSSAWVRRSLVEV